MCSFHPVSHNNVSANKPSSICPTVACSNCSWNRKIRRTDTSSWRPCLVTMELHNSSTRTPLQSELLISNYSMRHMNAGARLRSHITYAVAPGSCGLCPTSDWNALKWFQKLFLLWFFCLTRRDISELDWARKGVINFIVKKGQVMVDWILFRFFVW